jgi:ectoine hydroxylase-related dioxygenase (phytanoyl-CoA dioxygenase family)
LEDLGCDLERTYFDVPRMRSSTSDNYLTTGIAFAWHPHRDTWYSAPPCQINWWLPIYEIESDNAMAFHPRYWSQPVKNSSAGYNYYTWNKLHRGQNVAKFVKEDTRPLPRATEPMTLDPQVRLICPVGGVILFSGAQMHSSVPNTSGVTRFSIDFRTVHLDDAVEKRGAPNIDSACTGTVMRDYLRGTDLSRMPQELIALYDDGTEGDGELLYVPEDLTAEKAQVS